MNILFLNPPFGWQRPEGLDAPMGIMYLSAVLKLAGHSCFLVDHAWERPDDWTRWDAAIAEKPDMVLVNTQIRFTDETREALVRLRARQPACPAIAFGPQASAESARLLDMGFDACVVGEPEDVLVETFEKSNCPADWAPRAGLATAGNPHPSPAPRVNVETLPFPDWDLADYGRYIRTTHNAVFMASRGLNYPDAFSQPPLIYANTPTYRCSVERVISELLEIRHRVPGHYMLLFHDEIFTENREWVVELCSQLKKARLGIPFWCFTRPDLLDNELCRIMLQSGFVGVSMGMESGSDRILELLGRNLSREKIEAGFRAAQGAGLLTVGSVMIGTPGVGLNHSDETMEEIKATVALVQALHPDVLTITLTTPLPGTSLYGHTSGRIRAVSQEDFNYYHVWPGKYPLQLENLTPEDLTDAVTLLRSAWKRRLLRTVWQMAKLGCKKSDFRKTMMAQAVKVFRRKIGVRGLVD